MKRNIFIALAAFAICSSCSDSYYLPETEQDLAQLNSEYDDVKAKEADDEGEKIETLASEAEIQASFVFSSFPAKKNLKSICLTI